MSKKRSIDSENLPYPNPTRKRQRVLNKTKGRCIYCNVKLQYGSGKDIDADNAYELDHLYPKSKGGTDCGDDNHVPSCRKCNRAKFNMTVQEWYSYMSQKRIDLLNQVIDLESMLVNLESKFGVK